MYYCSPARQALYPGEAFARELQRRQQPFTALSRSQADYSRFEVLLKYLQSNQPEFVVSAAGYTGKPNVDASVNARADTLQGNTLLPQTIAQAVPPRETPWGHKSSGCIFSGAKIAAAGLPGQLEKDMTRSDSAGFRWRKIPAPFMASRKPTSPISLSASRRAAFTAAPRRSPRKPSAVRPELHLAPAHSVR